MSENNEEKKIQSNIKSSFTSRKFRMGAYATAVSAIVIVIVIVINLFVAKMDITVDMTASGKYSLTQETIDLVQNLKDDITIYYLCQSGQEIEEFKKIIKNYDKLDHVSVVYKDPVQYPKFASQYVDDKISDQSFLVVNESNGRAKYLAYADVMDYNYDYNTGDYNFTGINIESKVDGAIQAITNEKLPVLYAVAGHGETEISTYMGTLFKEGNITYSNLNTLTSESIPEDCDVLWINQPQYDYTKDETNMILDYLKSGKDAIITVDYVAPTLPNLNSILQYYGVTLVDGIVVETDTNHTRGSYPTELVPEVQSSDITDGFLNDKFVVCPISTGFTVSSELRDTLKNQEILKTSDSSYSKVDVNSSTIEKEDGDIDGPFLLGVEVTEPVGEEETNLAVYSSKYLWDDNYMATTAYGNGDLLLNTINQMAGQENTATVRSVSLAEEKLVMTQSQLNQNGLLLIAIIPLIFIIPGICVVVSRRKK